MTSAMDTPLGARLVQSTTEPSVASKDPPPAKDGSRDPSTTEPRLPASDPAWQWLSYKKFEKKGMTELKRIDETEEATDDGPFKVYYRVGNRRPCPDLVEVLLTSPSLIGCLQRCLPDHGDLKSVVQPTVTGRDLYAVLPKLKCCEVEVGSKTPGDDHPDSRDLASNGSQLPNGSHLTHGEHHGKELGEIGTKEAGADDGPTMANLYVRHLVRFLEGEYKDVLKKESRMRKEERITWDMLWAFLPKGTKVGYYCQMTGELLYAVVGGTLYRKKREYMDEDEEIFRVQLNAYDYDGARFKPCTISRDIDRFHEEHRFSELPVCPVEFLGDPADLEKRFLANGKRFHELAVQTPNRFMDYEGSMYYYTRPTGCWQLNVERADGRVMIDLCSFAQMIPDYPMGTARPPTKSCRGSCRVPETKTQAAVTSSNLVFAPATVYGFSFALKKWGCFSVSQFSDITFDRGAFHHLVMEPTLKTFVHDLVRQYISFNNKDSEDSSEQLDFIKEKGQGCIVLCHGPPGTGKTLTAESIAESMDCPLWALSVSELGTTPKELEMTLVKILHIAAVWKAVLLLDEADIYLERRSSQNDVVRNSMTGIFLRQLECFRGILFLTTNRIETMDDAFKSRISVFLHYDELDLAERANVWANLLRRANMEGATPEFCEKMASKLSNGREIRNAIRTSQVWAKAKGERFEAKHIETVLIPLIGTHRRQQITD